MLKLAMISRLHHFEIGASKPDQMISKLTNQYGFVPCGERVAAGLKQVVLTTGPECFVIVTDLSAESVKSYETHPTPDFAPGLAAKDLATRVNSVFNLSFEVDDINVVAKHLEFHKDIATVIQSGTVSNNQGKVRYITIKSIVGDMIHTMIDKRDYQGPFLPLFTPLPSKVDVNTMTNSNFTHLDHVAYGLRPYQSNDVIAWYKKVFNFKRMLTTDKESKKDGYKVMAGATGMILRCVVPQRCAPAFSIVLAEPVIIKMEDATGNSQKLFLDAHGGPGVHHLAFHTNDIIKAIKRLEEVGVAFVPRPPDTYYDEMAEIFSKSKFPISVPEMKEHGILVDVEKQSASSVIDWIKTPELRKSERMILQKFTRPLADNTGETVFVEVIERRGGAKAFGADNVAALWKSLVKHLEKERMAKGGVVQQQEAPQESQQAVTISY